jgi:acetyl-CoA carboxylase biotin carboxyl carrier protein
MAKKNAKINPKKSTAPKGEATMNLKNAGPMEPALLERIIQLMTEHDISSVDLRDGARRVSLKRGAQVVMGSAPVSYAPAKTVAAEATTPANVVATSKSVPAPSDDAGLIPIKSPMVGTFYSKPSPDAPKPFVTVGSVVNEDSDVCIIEAMKVFNNIKAEKSGTVAKVLVSDGQSVEFGTVLFLLKP